MVIIYYLKGYVLFMIIKSSKNIKHAWKWTVRETNQSLPDTVEPYVLTCQFHRHGSKSTLMYPSLYRPFSLFVQIFT